MRQYIWVYEHMIDVVCPGQDTVSAACRHLCKQDDPVDCNCNYQVKKHLFRDCSMSTDVSKLRRVPFLDTTRMLLAVEVYDSIDF